MDRGDGPLPEVRGQRNGSSNGTPQSASSAFEQPVGGGASNTSTGNIVQTQPSYAPNQPFLGAGTSTFTDVPVQQAFEATGFMDSNNSNSAMDFLGPVEGVYDAINFPEGILDFYGWGRFFEGSAQGATGASENDAFAGLQNPTNGGL